MTKQGAFDAGPSPGSPQFATQAQVVVRSTPEDDNITIAVTVAGVARYLNRHAHLLNCGISRPIAGTEQHPACNH